jgi:hypothetical protein
VSGEPALAASVPSTGSRSSDRVDAEDKWPPECTAEQIADLSRTVDRRTAATGQHTSVDD